MLQKANILNVVYTIHITLYCYHAYNIILLLHTMISHANYNLPATTTSVVCCSQIDLEAASYIAH